MNRPVVILVGALCIAPFARAEPVLEIRARSRLSVRATVDASGARARVAVTDDIGSPRQGVVVVANADGCPPATCRTRPDGACQLRFEACSPTRLDARVDDSGAYEGAEASTSFSSDGGAPRLSLSTSTGTQIDLDAPELRVIVRVTESGEPLLIVLTDELGRQLAHRADVSTSAEFALRTPELGPLGIGRIVAEARLRNQVVARAETMVVRSRRSHLELVRSGDRVVATLRDRVGAIAGQVVSIERDGADWKDATTDSDGRAAFRLDEGEHRYVALFRGDGAGRSSARSTTLAAELERPRSRLWLVPFATLGAILVALRRRRTSPSAAPLVTARPRPPAVARGERRRWSASERSVSFLVLSREDDAPIEGARVSLGDEVNVTTDSGGYATFSPPSGRHVVEVEVEGRAPESLTIDVPHRGEWTAAIVRLETIRAHARRAIETVTTAAATDHEDPDVLTLREAEARLVPTEDATFVHDTETTVYSRTSPTMEEARERIARARVRASPRSAHAEEPETTPDTPESPIVSEP